MICSGLRSSSVPIILISTCKQKVFLRALMIQFIRLRFIFTSVVKQLVICVVRRWIWQFCLAFGDHLTARSFNFRQSQLQNGTDNTNDRAARQVDSLKFSVNFHQNVANPEESKLVTQIKSLFVRRQIRRETAFGLCVELLEKKTLFEWLKQVNMSSPRTSSFSCNCL